MIDIYGIFIYYVIEDKLFIVFNIVWIKNDELLNVENINYVGGFLEDMFLKIILLIVVDGVKYCCIIINVVGLVLMDVIFGNF